MKKGSGIKLPSKKRAEEKAAVKDVESLDLKKSPSRKVITYRVSETKRDVLLAHAFNNKTSVQAMLDKALDLLAVEDDIDLPVEEE